MNTKNPWRTAVRGRLCPLSDSVGFTLVETLVSMAILLAGIVVVAQVFSLSVSTNIATRRMTTATLLATMKMEQLRAIPFESLAIGGSLDPDNAVTGFWEYITVAQDGTISADTTTTRAPYLQLWSVTGTEPKTIEVLIYSQHSSLGRPRMELTRTSTSVAKRF